MPSGGGSAGGGGGGGGGGGFGGSSSWSSRRSHSFRNTRSTYGSSGTSEDCDCECGKAMACFQCLLISGFVALFCLIVGLSVGFGVRNQQMPKSKIATDFYSPGDSRLVSFSSFFCNSVRFSVESRATGALFFIVDSVPPLTDQNNFTINASDTLDKNNYHFWQYHLYPNSKVTLDVCTDCSRVFLDIYVVKGNTNVNRWGDEPGENHAVLFQSVSDTVCPDKQTLTYSVTEEDEYYIIVHNSFDKIELFYNFTLAVERFEYESPSVDTNSTIRDNCAVSSGGTCTLDIPYGTGSQRALVVTTIPEDVDWAENVAIKTSCSRRHWAYAVVVLVSLFAAAVVIAIVVLVTWWCCCVDSEGTETSDGVDNTDNIDKVDNPDNIDTVAIECNDFDNVDKIDT